MAAATSPPLLAALLLLLLLPALGAAQNCKIKDSSLFISNFKPTVDMSQTTASKVCYKIATNRPTPRKTFGPSECGSDPSQQPKAIKGLYLSYNTVRKECLVTKELSKMVVSVDGVVQKKRPLKASTKFNTVMNLQVTKNADKEMTVCLDVSAASTGCKTVDRLFFNDTGGIITIKTLKGTDTCCIFGPVENPYVDAITVNSATSNGLYNITVVGTSPKTDSFNTLEAALFSLVTSAAGDLAKLIQVDVPDAPAGPDYTGNTAVPGTVPELASYTQAVDDLVIFTSLVKMDGVGGAYVKAGPLVSREKSSIPISGRLLVDVDDFAKAVPSSGPFPGTNTPQNAVVWKDLFKRQIARIMGVGTLWKDLGCTSNCEAGKPSSIQVSKCPATVRESFINGCGLDVRVETGSGAEDNCVWFSEAEHPSELMTPKTSWGPDTFLGGYPTAATEFISSLTAANLEDIYGPGSVSAYTFTTGTGGNVKPCFRPPDQKTGNVVAPAAAPAPAEAQAAPPAIVHRPLFSLPNGGGPIWVRAENFPADEVKNIPTGTPLRH